MVIQQSEQPFNAIGVLDQRIGDAVVGSLYASLLVQVASDQF